MADNVISNLSIVVNTNADEVAGKFRRLTSAVNGLGSAASSAGGGMETAAEGAEDMGMATQEAGESAGKAAPKIREAGRAARDAGKDAKSGSTGIGHFWQSLKRVAYMRTLRWIVKEIANAFKEGAQNLYQWSAANPRLSDFKKNMDRIATSVLYLKNSLGALLEPIVRILTPIIEWVVDKLVWVIDKITMFFAALSGSYTYTAAKKVATTWSDAADDVASSADHAAGSTHDMAEEIKRTILGFDEINKLEKENAASWGSGGSGGGSSGSTSPSTDDMFEEKEIAPWLRWIADFVNKIKSIVEKINGFFDGIFGKIKQAFGDAQNALDQLNDDLTNTEEEQRNITVNLIKGQWFELDEMPMKVDIPIDLVKADSWKDVGLLRYLGLYNLMITISVDLVRADGWKNLTALAYLNVAHLATEVTVDLVRADSWKNLTALAYLNIAHLATEVTVDLVRSDGWKNLTALAYLNVANLATKITVDLVRADSWKNLTALAYLNVANLSTKIVADLVRSDDWKNLTALAYLNVANLATKVTVDLVRADSWKNLTALAYLNLANLATTVTVDLVRADAWKNLTALAYLNLANLATKVSVDLERAAGWKNLTALAYLNIANLKTSVTVDLKKGDGWDAVDGFGGASGGGGNTSGSGAGRGNWTVDVDVQMPTKEKSKGLLQKWWDALQWSANVEIGFAAKLLDKTGKVIDGTVGKALDWLFPGAKAEDNKVNITFNASAGTGMTLNGNKLGVNYGTLNSSGTVNVNGVAGDGLVFSNTNHHYTLAGVDNASATVNVSGATDGKTGLGMSGSGSFMLKKVAGTSSTVSVSGSPVANAGLKLTKSKGFALVIKAAKATVKASATVIKNKGLKMSKGQITPDTKGSTASVIAKVNTGKSDSAAVNALTAGSVTKGVNLSITAQTGGAGGSGLPGDVGVEDFGAQAIDSATSSLVAFLNVFNQLGKNVTKNLKVKVTDSNTLDNETKRALDWKSGDTKNLNMSIGLNSINSTVQLALSGIGKTLTGVIKYTIEVAKSSVEWLGSALASFFQPKKALGGVFSNGAWSSIPQYAGGTTNAHGSLFFAGEAGPEVVGHVGGRTEVLNRSQLAATMYSAVRSAMSGITLDANFYTGNSGEESDYDVMYQAMYDALSAVMARGEERDREKVALLRSINDKDFQPEITASSIAHGMSRMNRRAGTTVVPVGT